MKFPFFLRTSLSSLYCYGVNADLAHTVPARCRTSYSYIHRNLTCIHS